MGSVQTKTGKLKPTLTALQRTKGSGKSIIATARKLSEIIWHMLNSDEEFNPALMIDKKLARKADSMRIAASKSA